MVMNCGEFARQGYTLLEGASGYPEIGEVPIITRSQGRYRVLSLRVGPPHADQSWVDNHFSAAAAAEVLSAVPPPPQTQSAMTLWVAKNVLG